MSVALWISAVEAFVRLRHQLGPARRGRVPHRLQLGVERRQRRVIRPGGGQRRGGAFERGADAAHLGLPFRAEFGDHRAAARQGDHHAVLFQPAQRFPHRLGGDAQCGGQAAFGDAAARGKRALDDAIAQPAIGALGQRERILLGQPFDRVGCGGTHGSCNSRLQGD